MLFGHAARGSSERSESGAAMVEFALILPLLLMLVFGTIEFGRAYNAQNTLTHAAREGAREYAITQDATAGEDAARNAATSLKQSLLTVTMSACNAGQPATATLQYPFQINIAFWRVTNFTMQAEGVMRCGG